MKLAINTLFFLPFLMILLSCPVEQKNVAKLYYKSAFLGADSFQLKGAIYNRNGNPITGNKIIAKIYRYELNDWNIEGTLDGGQFTININKTDGNGNSLPINKDDNDYRYDTVWEFFTSYFSVPGNYSEEKRSKKMYGLNIFLNEDKYENRLYEFIDDKPTKYFDYSIDYVYIPEPVEISGIYCFEDEFWEYYYSFDCDFSKPGWYKIFNDFKPIGNDQSYTSSVNTKYYKD